MSQVDPKIKALQDSIFLSKVAKARRAPMNERLAAGLLFIDQCCQIVRGAIRSRFPGCTEEQVEQEFQRRLASAKELSDCDIYRDAGMNDDE